MMKFSIVIPARNEEGYLAKTLQSIENQDYDDYEIIVVANGCTDNTAQIAEKYADKVISIKESGVSKARNLGAEEAQGEILIFLDADTRLGPGVLKNIKNKFDYQFGVGTVKVKPHKASLQYKLMMNFKNLIHGLKVYTGTSGIIYCRKNDFPGFNEKVNVKENFFLVRQLLQKGKYQFLNGSYVVTSMRRYERWGLLRLGMFFVKKWFKNLFSNVEGDNYPVVR